MQLVPCKYRRGEDGAGRRSRRLVAFENRHRIQDAFIQLTDFPLDRCDPDLVIVDSVLNDGKLPVEDRSMRGADFRSNRTKRRLNIGRRAD
jgi:hypothetical protein